MGLFEDLGERVERFKQQAVDASRAQAEYECRACGEPVYTDQERCPECGSEDLLERVTETEAGTETETAAGAGTGTDGREHDESASEDEAGGADGSERPPDEVEEGTDADSERSGDSR